MNLLISLRRGALAALALIALPAGALAATPIYTAIVDGGSGGTRLYFYKVTPGPYPLSELLLQTSVEDPPGTPYEEDDGIDNYACFPGGDPDAQAFYATENVNPNVMLPLWTALKGKIATITPAITSADVTVKVFATAGMRTAAEVCGQASVDKLYGVIRSGMVASGLTNVANEVRTIDGATEEGVWSFVNVNDEYANAFGRPGHPKPVGAPVGMVEVGGSSMQLVYPIAATSPDAAAVKIRLNSRTFTLHAQSWLHLGQDDMRKSLRDYKVGGRSIAHRCWANGFDKANDLGDVGHASLAQNGAFGPLDTVCPGFMRNHLRKYYKTPPDLSGTSVKFVGVGGLKYTLDGFGVLAGPLAGPTGLVANVRKRCSASASTWPEINTQANAQRMCPHGAYVSALMMDGQFGLFRKRPGQFERALVAKDVAGKALSWISGYLLLTYSR